MKLQTMSRIFRVYHPYHPYDPYLDEELNQISRYYLHATTCDKSKGGKDRKDHVIQTFQYKSESKSRVFRYCLPWQGECIPYDLLNKR
jgi:hypothetical protein